MTFADSSGEAAVVLQPIPANEWLMMKAQGRDLAILVQSPEVNLAASSASSANLTCLLSAPSTMKRSLCLGGAPFTNSAK